MTSVTFRCPMCQRDIPKRGKSIYVGQPTKFLVCWDCWKGYVVRNCKNLLKVYQGTKKWTKEGKEV